VSVTSRWLTTALLFCRTLLGIPVKVNAYSGGKPNGVPVGS